MSLRMLNFYSGQSLPCSIFRLFGKMSKDYRSYTPASPYIHVDFDVSSSVCFKVFDEGRRMSSDRRLRAVVIISSNLNSYSAD